MPLQQVKILYQPLKAKWYRMIEAGVKTEEYREITPYWLTRVFEINDDDITGNYNPMQKEIAESLAHHPDCSELLSEAAECYEIRPRYTHVQFSLGYPKKDDATRRMTFELKGIECREGREEWGAEKGKKHLVEVLGRRTTLDGTKLWED